MSWNSNNDKRLSLKKPLLDNSKLNRKFDVNQSRFCEFDRDSHGYGFKITGNAPVKVQAVREGGAAWRAGIRENDVLIEINGFSVVDKSHAEVVVLIRKENHVKLKVQSTVSPNRKSFTSSSFSQIPVAEVTQKTKKLPSTSTSPSAQDTNTRDFLSTNSKGNISLTKNQRPLPPSSLLRKANTQNSNISIGTLNIGNNIINTKRNSNNSINNNNSNNFKSTGRPKSVSGAMLQSQNEESDSSDASQESEDLSESDISSTSSEKESKTSSEVKFIEESTSLHKLEKELEDEKAQRATESVTALTSSSKMKLEFLSIPKKHISSDGSSPTIDETETENYKNRTLPPQAPIKSHSYHVSSSVRTFNSEPEVKEIISPSMVKRLNAQSNSMDSSKVSRFGYNTLPQKSSRNRFLGREYTSDSEDEMLDESAKTSSHLIDLFSDYNNALNRPSIVAFLINTAKDQPEYLYAIFFYFCCKMYEMQQSRLDFQSHSKRMANEIITTFLLDESPLRVCVKNEIKSEIFTILKNTDDLGNIFQVVKLSIFDRIVSFIDGVKQKIQRGTVFTDLPNVENNENDMMKLYRLFEIFNPKSSKDQELDDLTKAIQVVYATMYCTFARSQVVQSGQSYKWKTKSNDNLSLNPKILSISETYKIPILCAYSESKNFSIRKKSKNINGHSMNQENCIEPEKCAVCKKLLWGPTGQVLKCNSCLSFIHKECRKKFKASCNKKLKKSNSQSSLKEEKISNQSTGLLGRLSRKSSGVSLRSTNNTSFGDSLNTSTDIPTSNINATVHHLNEKTNQLINENESELRKSFSEERLTRSQSVHSVIDPTLSFERNLSGVFDSNLPSNKEINGEVGYKVQLKELVPEELQNDPNMQVDESFDAGSEMQTYFPDMSDDTDQTRIIVLLEFYHKTRYILMNMLKLYYKVVLVWPENNQHYFKIVGLDAVEPFIMLIKSLVSTIEGCIGKTDFINLGEKVLEWLTANDESNLKQWIALSSTLVCTNSLHSTKQIKSQLKLIPEFAQVAQAKLKKSLVLDELSQMRPLLFSLPLIVRNITKCLSKKLDPFEEELKIWMEISIKMDCICEFIDSCCVPLVDWTNSGSIIRSRFETLRSIKENGIDDLREYCQEFPRLIFQFPLYDFQLAKVFEWRSNMRIGLGSGNEGVQSKYFKKGADILLLFYHSFIVVLQKEGDHYILKWIKAQRGLTDRQFPILSISSDIIVNVGGQEENWHILNIIQNTAEYALLIRIGFKNRKIADNWMELIKAKNFNLQRTIEISRSIQLPTNIPTTPGFSLPGQYQSMYLPSTTKSPILNKSSLSSKLNYSESVGGIYSQSSATIYSSPSEGEADQQQNEEISCRKAIQDSIDKISMTVMDQSKQLNEVVDSNLMNHLLEATGSTKPSSQLEAYYGLYKCTVDLVKLTNQQLRQETTNNLSDINNISKQLTLITEYLSELKKEIPVKMPKENLYQKEINTSNIINEDVEDDIFEESQNIDLMISSTIDIIPSSNTHTNIQELVDDIITEALEKISVSTLCDDEVDEALVPQYVYKEKVPINPIWKSEAEHNVSNDDTTLDLNNININNNDSNTEYKSTNMNDLTDTRIITSKCYQYVPSTSLEPANNDDVKDNIEELIVNFTEPEPTQYRDPIIVPNYVKPPIIMKSNSNS